jgi:hypothetical protein
MTLYLTGDTGEEVIEFSELPPGKALYSDHYGQVRGHTAIECSDSAWEITALGVAGEPPLWPETTSSHDGFVYPAYRSFHAGALVVIRGCFHVLQVACAQLQEAGVFPTKLLIPQRQNAGFVVQGVGSACKLRFSWKRLPTDPRMR